MLQPMSGPLVVGVCHVFPVSADRHGSSRYARIYAVVGQTNSVCASRCLVAFGVGGQTVVNPGFRGHTTPILRLRWLRPSIIQETFRFQSPLTYEIIASAAVVAAASVALIKRLGLKTISGEPIMIPPKSLGHRRSLRGWWRDPRSGMGTHGSLPRPTFRARRQWRNRDDRRHWQGASWDVAVWTPEVKTSALACILVRPPRCTVYPPKNLTPFGV